MSLSRWAWQTMQGKYEETWPKTNVSLKKLEGALGAVTTYLNNSGTINVLDYGAKGDGIADDGASLTRAVAAATAAGVAVVFPAGTYAYATSPNFALGGSYLSIVTEGVVIFKHTGSGVGVKFDGSAEATGFAQHMTVGPIILVGNSNTTTGFQFTKLAHCEIHTPLVRTMGTGATDKGIQTKWCVLCEFHSPTVSVNVPSAGSMPGIGLCVDKVGSGEYTSACTVINPIVEGCSVVGIQLAGSLANVFIGGAAESNYDNVTAGSDAHQDKFFGLDTEDCTNEAYRIAGESLEFFGCLCANGVFRVLSGATFVAVHGGHYAGLRVDGGALDTVLDYCRTDTAVVDSGTRTRLNNVVQSDGAGVYVSTGPSAVSRVIARGGTPHAAGDYALSAGWGASGAVVVTGGIWGASDFGGIVEAGCNGVASANPTVTLTFKDGAWPAAPFVVATRVDILAPTTGFWAVTNVTTTAAVFTFVGTPVSGSGYDFSFVVIGR